MRDRTRRVWRWALLLALALAGAWALTGLSRDHRPVPGTPAAYPDAPAVAGPELAPHAPPLSPEDGSWRAAGGRGGLAARAGITVRVVDADDREPIEGALVFFTAHPAGLVHSGRMDRTGPDGAAGVDLPPALPWLNVQAAEYVPWQKKVADEPAPAEVLAELPRGRTVRGVVVGLGEQPIEGAEVFFHPPENRIGTAPRRDGEGLRFAGFRGTLARAQSDSAGRFVVQGIPEGVPLVAWAQKPGWVPRLSLQHELGVAESELRIELLPTLEFVLEVLDAQTEAPVAPLRPSCSVAFPPHCYAGGEVPRSWPFAPAATVSGAPHVIWRRLYLYPDYVAPDPTTVPWICRVHLACVGYEPRQVDLRLEPGGVVRERVLLVPTRAQREPIQLQARFSDDSPYSGELGVDITPTTGDESARNRASQARLRFVGGAATEVLWLPPGRYVFTPVGLASAASLEHAWWTPAGRALELDHDSSRGQREATLELDGGVIALTVLDAKGQPVRGYDLELRAGGRQRHQASMWDMVHVVSAAPESHAAAPLLRLPLGRFTLAARLPGVGTGHIDVEVTSTQTPTPVTLRLE